MRQEPLAGSKDLIHDAIVVGVGGMGSAALYHLAKRGKKVGTLLP